MISAHQVFLAVIHRFSESNFKKSIVLSYDIEKSLKALCFQGFFLFLESADPYLDPLCFCHTMDVLIHSVCALTFHAACGVSVHIKGKRRGLMSEIFLHSLDVIAGLQAVYGVCRCWIPGRAKTCWVHSLQTLYCKFCLSWHKMNASTFVNDRQRGLPQPRRGV